MDKDVTQADLAAAYRAGAKDALDAAAKAITDLQYDGREVHDTFAEGIMAAYEAVADINPSHIRKTA
jgi:predicted metal-dependent RNase